MAEKPKKKRISTLAKSYEVSSDLIIGLLKSADVEVKSAASMISSDAFALIKPALLKEIERIERKEMAAAGRKIPMKAVLKKASKMPGISTSITKKPAELKAKITEPPKPEIEKPTEQETTPDIKPEVESKEPVDTPSAPIAESEAPVQVTTPEPEEVSSSKPEEPEKPAEIQDNVELAAEKKEDQVSNGSEEEKPEPTAETKEILEEPDKVGLKVTVEKPDEQLAARIQKYVLEKNKRSISGKGYSGRFGKVPSPRKPKQRETTSTDKPKDVFAMRAQQAGVMVGGQATPENKTDSRKERDFQKKKTKRTRGKIKKTKEQVEQELAAMKSNVNKVMATVSRSSQKVKYRKEKIEIQKSDEKVILKVSEFITISELAGLMNTMPNLVIAKCMELGMMVTINQRLDHETIAIIADEFNYVVQLMDEYVEDTETEEEIIDESTLSVRAPVVTIMGHVDHGKTSILDYIRKSNVVAGETGGITQHVGAYSVNTPSGRICFLDTPGHEAFTAMRSRGAQVTDIVVLVVAADSMVMPQTKEAIQHARTANVRLVVAINKIDLPNANPDNIKTQLAAENVSVEGWGGDVSCVEVSAKTGLNIDKLLEVISLEAEVMELKANPEKMAKGTVIETRLDRGKGAIATILVQEGTLKVGEPFLCGSFSGKVRSLIDEHGKRVKSAGPSTPIQVIGLEGTPQAGDGFAVMESEREAREVSARRREAAKDRELRQKRHITLDQLHEKIESGEFHELKVIIKGDVDGSIEAISTSLDRLSTPEVKINIISYGVGAVKEADIHLASASNAIIIAFHVLPSDNVRQLAEEEGVQINYYRVIYDVVSDVKAAMEGLLSPEVVEEVTGEAKILQLFKIPKVGIIAGCVVNSGTVDRDAKVRLYRDGIEISEAKVTSLKRVKDDVRSVKSGLECGIGIEGIQKEIQEGDTLAFFKLVKKARKLSTVE